MLLDPFEHAYVDAVYDEPPPIVFYETPKAVLRAGPGELLIPLSKGFEALIDAVDLVTMQGRKFCASKSRSNWYARNVGIGYLHRLITGAKPEWVVDHKNRNTMDNRRSNLKICGFNENAQNAEYAAGSTGYRGVSKNGTRYRARITTDGVPKSLGCFSDPLDAARAYDAAALEIYGPFAWTNFEQDEIPF